MDANVPDPDMCYDTMCVKAWGGMTVPHPKDDNCKFMKSSEWEHFQDQTAMTMAMMSGLMTRFAAGIITVMDDITHSDCECDPCVKIRAILVEFVPPDVTDAH